MKCWYDNWKILYQEDKYLDFMPNSSMTMCEKINAVVRFCIYFIILSLIFNKSQRILVLPVLVIFITIILKNKTTENFDDNIIKMFESGTLDSNGNYNIGKPDKHDVQKYENVKEHIENYPKLDLNENKKQIRRPTTDNPYMNPFVVDYNDDEFEIDKNVLEFNADDDEIKNKEDGITKNFEKGLYMNIDDLWEIKNSQRQFYTLPVTSFASGQKEFANWLFKIKETCKTDQTGCLRYEDLRYKK